MRTRRVKFPRSPALVAAGLLTACLALVASPAHAGGTGPASAIGAARSAHTKAHPKIVPVLGSSKYLAYVTATTANRLYPTPYPSGTLHVMTKSGKRTALGTVSYFDKVSLAGSLLVVFDTSLTTSISIDWWNLAKHTKGTYTLQGEETPVSAAPNGWVYSVQEGSLHLVQQSISGARTDLGDPIKPGYDYGVLSDSTGLVAFGENNDGNGQVSYMSWARPGRFRTLQKPSTNDYDCSGMSSTYISCSVSRGTTLGVTLFPTNGKHATTVSPKCPTSLPSVYNNTAVWVGTIATHCLDGRPNAMSRSGHVVKGKRLYGDPAVVSAFHRIVVCSSNQRKLLSLKSVSAKPKALAHA